MTTHESANNQDPSLFCAYFGGPRDGLKSGDLPAVFSGKSLTGMVSRTPLTQPHQFSLYAVYVCTSETQVNGFWRFEFVGFEGPNGEQLVAVESISPQSHEPADSAVAGTTSSADSPATSGRDSAALTVSEFNAELVQWLDRTTDRTIGVGRLTQSEVLIGRTRCRLAADTTRSGVTAYLERLARSDGVYSLVRSSEDVVRRVVPGRSPSRIPGFYLYSEAPLSDPQVIAPVDSDMDGWEISMLLLEAIAVLHRRGHQRLRIYPNISGSGIYWRTVVVDADFARSQGARPDDWFSLGDFKSFSYTMADRYNVCGLIVDSQTNAAELADHLLATIPRDRIGMGRDWMYVGWYVEMLESALRYRNLPVGDDGWIFLPAKGNRVDPPPTANGRED